MLFPTVDIFIVPSPIENLSGMPPAPAFAAMDFSVNSCLRTRGLKPSKPFSIEPVRRMVASNSAFRPVGRFSDIVPLASWTSAKRPRQLRVGIEISTSPLPNTASTPPPVSSSFALVSRKFILSAPSTFDTLRSPEEVAAALASHRVRLQAAVGRQLRIKRTPELSFSPDPAIAVGTRVEEILRGLRHDEVPPPDQGAEDG